MHTTIEATIIRDHEHDLPLQHVIVHQPTAYAWDILVTLHLLELPTQKAGGCGGGHGCFVVFFVRC